MSILAQPAVTAVIALLSLGVPIAFLVGRALTRARASASLQNLDAQLAARSADCTRIATELGAVRSQLEATENSLRSELERRSAAEERASQVPALSNQVAHLNTRVSEFQDHLTRLREEKAHLESTRASLQRDLDRVTDETRVATEDREAVRGCNSRLSEELADARAKLDSAREQLLKIDALKEQMSLEFQSVASRILDDNSRKFSEQNQSNLSGILDPLRERIREFQQTVQQVHSTDTRERASLQTEIRNMAELNRQMTEDATNLTNALKGNSKSQGTWGKSYLKRFSSPPGSAMATSS